MSQKICVQFDIRSILIMKDTLRQMGIAFNEVNEEKLTIQRSYMPITMDAKAGTITHDSAHTGEVNKIKQMYSINFYRDQAIKEGMQLKQETNAKGEVILYVTK